MSGHRRDVRPRYGRIGVLAASVTISAVAALGGFGILATGSAQAGAGAKPASYTEKKPAPNTSTDAVGGSKTGSTPDHTSDDTSDSSAGGPNSSTSGDPSSPSTSSGTPEQPLSSTTNTNSDLGTTSAKAVPADSGSGRRIVFSQSEQRVWLMGSSSDDVQRTYLVSGSVTHNLQPGTYSVYSKSRWAVGIDDSGVMQYFVRFTQGPTGAAIGFHSIPTKNGVPLQSRAQLGTPESHGCIRQYLPNAIALWDFAPVGTKVVVVA
jgi:lipoprotein-anchoring transpeptidase ErfK/SrfK